MSQDIVNNNQSISYTNLDFSSIYTETLDLIKSLTYRWDPSISDESDPGVILVKLSALLADKCNYNIDKSILEAFPVSVTQDSNAQQLYEQLGYYMGWYEAGRVPVALSYIAQADERNEQVKTYTIPKFTIITDDEEKINYGLIGTEGADGIIVSDGNVYTDSRELKMVALEGIPTKYTYLGEYSVITPQMVDKETHRLYFDSKHTVAQNGVFITNTNQNNYADWKRVDNIYEQSYDELRYKFGYDIYSNACFLEFPDNYSELFGDGIEITYMVLSPETSSDVPAQTLTRFLYGVTPKEDTSVFLDASNMKIQNYAKATGHKDKETIDEAYVNYKKTVGTFHTLITLRDYLNFIRSKELNICSNAFVCDRTNDIQSSYKIVSKQRNLDSIIVKVEKLVDKTTIESNFDYKFEKSGDESSIPGKAYYIIENDRLQEVGDTTNKNPYSEGWYEFVSSIPAQYDALTPYSLKFYLLKNSIALDDKQAFNETFEVDKNELDLNALLEDTAHLEHSYEPILPFGEHTYKITSDETFLENKSYFTRDADNIHYTLYTDYDIGDSTSSVTDTFYEIDIEALFPHVVLFKNIYPLTANILTYENLNSETQEIVTKNILKALYKGVNSSQLNFGEKISTNYLAQLIKASDDRIKDVNFESITYTTRAIYFDEKDNEFKEVSLSRSASNLDYTKKDDLTIKDPTTGWDVRIRNTGSGKIVEIKDPSDPIVGKYVEVTDETQLAKIFQELDRVYSEIHKEEVIARIIEKDILCKSILSGVTSLLTPDDVFTFHLNQEFLGYFDSISSITSQAIIDIGGKDAITTYSSESSNPYIRQSYTLKPNETLSLYRPQLQTIREFSSGIHYECFLYNGIKAGQSYELHKNEYMIFYQAYYEDNKTSGTPDGFSVYACTEGVIITPSADIAVQTNMNSLTSFARGRIIPNFDNTTDNWYETSTYAYNYCTEIYNNSSIINNVISGTNTIKIETLFTVELDAADNYKFFWVLKTPQYSNDKTLKTYTLFPEYDVSTERLAEKEKNSYTLKEGEWLYYIDSSNSNLAILGAGTTIYRNCGLNEVYDDDNANTCFSFINVNEFVNGDNPRFRDGTLELITDHIAGEDIINPKLNGWFVYDSINEAYVRTDDTLVDNSETYYVLVIDDNSGLYKQIGNEAPYEHSSTMQTSDVFDEVNLNDTMSNTNPKENDWYEFVTNGNSKVTDYYALSDNASYNNYTRYTKTNDTNILSRKIFSDVNYSTIDISDISTYKDVSITDNNIDNFDYISQRLVTPSDGDNSYKEYYTDSTGTTLVTDIQITDNPSTTENHLEQVWYEFKNDEYVATTDTRPVISSEPNSVKYPTTMNTTYCFEEVPVTSWETIHCSENGYFFKENSADPTYNWEPTRTTVEALVSTTSLQYLLDLYNTAKNHYPNDDNALIRYMIYEWDTGRVYNHPFKQSTKLGWRIKQFTDTVDGYTVDENNATHIGISSQEYRTLSGQLSTIEKYPATSYNADYGVVLPISVLSSITFSSFVYLYETSTYIEVLDMTNSSYTDLRNYLDYLWSTFNGTILQAVNIEFPLKFFKFKDLFKMNSKQYFTPNKYVTKIFDKVEPWTCVAMDNDQVAKDPVKNIEDNWQSVQYNTSLRIIQNEMWSFAEGDTLRFEAPVSNQNSIVWPRFSNTEIFLDLDSYSISYQRNGASIEELNKLALEKYDWQGYSHLLLNTSEKDGQKLESNHSLVLYKPNSDNTDLEEVAVINGSSYDNLTIQLKTPVSNVAGRYIDVTTQDIYGTSISNSVYVFAPLVNLNSLYKYGNDNYTYAFFTVEDVEKSGGVIRREITTNQVSIPLKLPKGKYILPVYTDTPGIRYSVSKYLQVQRQAFSYCPNLSPVISSDPDLTVRISHNIDKNGEVYGEHLYGYEKDKCVGSNNSEYYINDTNCHYLDLSIDAIPNNNDWLKVSLPAHLTEYYHNEFGENTSPSWFGWYEVDSTSETGYSISQNTSIGAALLEEVQIDDLSDNNTLLAYNPSELNWYEKMEEEVGGVTNYYYTLSLDTSVVLGKTYYKDKDFYIPFEGVTSQVLKVHADNPLLEINSNKVAIVFGDVFKYNNNPLFASDVFNDIKTKIRRLDDDSLYNYSFKPDKNDEIKNPLIPTEFFKANHPFNKYVIPQLDFDNFTCNFTTRSASRR